MSEKALRSVFIVGTLLSLLVLGAMTVDSLSQVVSARTPQVTDQVAQGKQVWQAKNCNDCHTILGIGGYYAPELTKTFDRRGEEWLRRFLKEPRAVDPRATMPNQGLTDVEVANLVAFFQWVARVDTNDWPPQPIMGLNVGPAAAGPSGSLVYQQKGCASCHTLNGQGAAGPGPDLSHMGSQRTAESLASYLENPKARNPQAIMPAIPMTQAERDALVNYMMGLK